MHTGQPPPSSTQWESFVDPTLFLLQWPLVCELHVGNMLNREQKRVKFLA